MGAAAESYEQLKTVLNRMATAIRSLSESNKKQATQLETVLAQQAEAKRANEELVSQINTLRDDAAKTFSRVQELEKNQETHDAADEAVLADLPSFVNQLPEWTKNDSVPVL